MKNLVIIGAGGMGREIYNLAMQCHGYQHEYVIKGFIDDNLQALDGLVHVYPPLIGKIVDYQIQVDDVFVCSIGDVFLRKKITETILDRGGEFVSLIHPTALINPTATLGRGCLVFPFAQVGSEAIVGDFVLLQSVCCIAHDVMVGNYTRIDVQVLCIGGIKIGNQVTIHSGAILNHKVVVEDDAVVGATSFVIRRVKKGSTVFGNPARVIC